MGIFQEFKNIGYKAKGNVILQNVFKQMKIVYKDKSALLTNIEKDSIRAALALAWENFPDVFDGKFGQRPAPLTLAFVGLVCLLDQFPEDQMATNPIFEPLLAPTIMLYSHHLKNYHRDPEIKPIDQQMFDLVEDPYKNTVERWRNATGGDEFEVSARYEITLQYAGI